MIVDLFDSAGVKRLQGANASLTMFLVVQGNESGWFSTHQKSLLVRFRGTAAGDCNRSFIRTLTERGQVDPSLSIYVTEAGYSALTSDWCGKLAFHWPIYICDMSEAITIRDGGGVIVE